MTDRDTFNALWAKFKEEEANSIGVDIKGWAHFIKRPMEEDTFLWVAGPEIVEFYKQHGLSVRSSSSSSERGITTFLFPKSRPDLAALFKLTFA